MEQLPLFGWKFWKQFGRARKESKPQQRVANPALQKLWYQLRRNWFPDRPDIDEYRVIWSSRPQKRTLASCSTEDKIIRVARELSYPQHSPWLEPLLYHEMCHCYIGNRVAASNGRRQWHGPEFKALEQRHPQIKAFNQWIRAGGWLSAIRSDRAKRAHAARRRAS